MRYAIIHENNKVTERGIFLESQSGYAYILINDVENKIKLLNKTLQVLNDKSEYDKHIDFIELSRKQFNNHDYKIVYESLEPHIKYAEICGLRQLNFIKETSIFNISIDELKQNTKQIIEQSHNEQIHYINEDEDITQTEKTNLLEITKICFDKYNKFLDECNDIKQILENWPTLFSEQNEYIPFLVSIMK